MKKGEIEWDSERKKLVHVEGGADYEVVSDDGDASEEDSAEEKEYKPKIVLERPARTPTPATSNGKQQSKYVPKKYFN